MTASEENYDLLKRQNEEIKVNKTKYHSGLYLLKSIYIDPIHNHEFSYFNHLFSSCAALRN